jgi:hypothetical protein
MNVGNDGAGAHGIVAKVGNDYMGVYDEFGLKPNN